MSIYGLIFSFIVLKSKSHFDFIKIKTFLEKKVKLKIEIVSKNDFIKMTFFIIGYSSSK
jgi:hypothetical protein